MWSKLTRLKSDFVKSREAFMTKIPNMFTVVSTPSMVVKLWPQKSLKCGHSVSSHLEAKNDSNSPKNDILLLSIEALSEPKYSKNLFLKKNLRTNLILCYDNKLR